MNSFQALSLSLSLFYSHNYVSITWLPESPRPPPNLVFPLTSSLIRWYLNKRQNNLSARLPDGILLANRFLFLDHSFPSLLKRHHIKRHILNFMLSVYIIHYHFLLLSSAHFLDTSLKHGGLWFIIIFFATLLPPC